MLGFALRNGHAEFVTLRITGDALERKAQI